MISKLSNIEYWNRVELVCRLSVSYLSVIQRISWRSTSWRMLSFVRSLRVWASRTILYHAHDLRNCIRTNYTYVWYIPGIIIWQLGFEAQLASPYDGNIQEEIFFVFFLRRWPSLKLRRREFAQFDENRRAVGKLSLCAIKIKTCAGGGEGTTPLTTACCPTERWGYNICNLPRVELKS